MNTVMSGCSHQAGGQVSAGKDVVTVVSGAGRLGDQPVRRGNRLLVPYAAGPLP
jgi:hypothetical protein